MKKQILSMVLCVCMILALTPVFATTGETAPAACNVLFDEDFEGETSFVPTNSDIICAIEEDGENYISTAYGQENKALFFAVATDNADSVIPFSFQHAPLVAGSTGYNVELSFDWNPVDYGSNSTNTTIKVGGARDFNRAVEGNIVSLKWTGGTDGNRTLTVTGRNYTKESIDLLSLIGEHAAHTDHVYRTRIVMAASPNSTSGTLGAKITIYMDGVLIDEFTHNASVKEKYIRTLQGNRNGDRGTIDNIKVVEYGTGVTGVDAYINDDALVAAIRRFEYEQASIAEDKLEAYSAAIAAAKVACEASDRTQASVDAAVEALNNWDNVEEESEWSAVSSVNGKTVTIQATEDIATGKIIVANYNGTDLAHVNLPVFSGLAAGETIDVTVPDGWTGAVKVFFWDGNFDRLMPAEELTIQ